MKKAGLKHKLYLLRLMVGRDIASRYKGSLLGIFWSFINPLLVMGLYAFVFAVFLRIRFDPNWDPAKTVVALICGMIPWAAFSEGISRSATVVAENATYTKKVLFPVEVLPMNVVLSAIVNEIIAMIILSAGILLAGKLNPMFLVPLSISFLAQLLFSSWIAWFVAGAGVFFRDLRQICPLVLMIWMFATPIFYPETMVPAEYRFILEWNPMTKIVQGFRASFLSEIQFPMRSLISIIIASAGFNLVSYLWFRKSKGSFAEAL